MLWMHEKRRNMDRFSLMNTFVRIAETGNISTVAREMGVSQPSVSKQLSALEIELGVRLLQRTTRRLNLTDAGATYYDSARRILDELADAEARVRQADAGLTGTLSVTTSQPLGLRLIVPLIARLQRLHPLLKVQLTLSDQVLDLVEEGIDVAIRGGRLADSTLVARKLGSIRLIVVGTPEYFARRGEPAVPSDLADHNVLSFQWIGHTPELRFVRGKSEFAVRTSAAFRSNSPLALVEAARQGMGIAVVTAWLVRDDLRTGALRAVLTDYELPPLDLNAVYPSARQVPLKVRAFIDLVQAECLTIADLC